MLFNSYEFLVFLPLVPCLCWAAARRLTVQSALLAAASYVSYAWWDVRFLLLIAGMTAVGYLAGLGIARTGREAPLPDGTPDMPLHAAPCRALLGRLPSGLYLLPILTTA